MRFVHVTLSAAISLEWKGHFGRSEKVSEQISKEQTGYWAKKTGLYHLVMKKENKVNYRTLFRFQSAFIYLRLPDAHNNL